MVFERVSDTRYNQSSLFTDFVPVTHKPISTVILGHWQRGKKKKKSVTHREHSQLGLSEVALLAVSAHIL